MFVSLSVNLDVVKLHSPADDLCFRAPFDIAKLSSPHHCELSELKHLDVMPFVFSQKEHMHSGKVASQVKSSILAFLDLHAYSAPPVMCEVSWEDHGEVRSHSLASTGS